MSLSETDKRVVCAVQNGLPLVTHPFAEAGRKAGLSEAALLARLRALSDAGAIKRFGLVVRHRELGYTANAMVVWSLADAAVEAAGRRLARVPWVTLCYRRPQRPPRWPYNLFCMIHGRHRDEVLAQIAELAALPELHGCAYDVLFSRRRFKQRGARYIERTTRRGNNVEHTHSV